VVAEDVDEFQSVWNVLDCSPAVDIYGSGDVHYPTRLDDQLETLDTLSGKLKTYCPILFELLTSWEREALDASGWRSTTKDLAPCMTFDPLALLKKYRVSFEPNVIIQPKDENTSSSSVVLPVNLPPCLGP
jgi:hypothetical protein